MTTTLKFVPGLPEKRPAGTEGRRLLKNAIVEELRAHRGNWAIIKTYPKSSSAQNIASRIKVYCPSDIEIIVRNATIYARAT